MYVYRYCLLLSLERNFSEQHYNGNKCSCKLDFNVPVFPINVLSKMRPLLVYVDVYALHSTLLLHFLEYQKVGT